MNPWAVVGQVALFFRQEGLIPNGHPQSAESSRRRVELARLLAAEFGVESLTAVERAAAHAAVRAGVR